MSRRFLPYSIFIGFDAREAAAYAVCRDSIRRRLTACIPIRALILDDLVQQGLYTRPTERRDGKLWDLISEAPMATEFAVSRFLVPHLARRGIRPGQPAGWALFMDSDMLVRANFVRLFETVADPQYAVMCVKHVHEPPPGVKMDGQEQVRYARKNWSSFVLFNLDHPANDALTPDLVNTVPGRDLHRFCWLKDEEIGELGPEWNFLVGHTDPSIEPKVIHYTEGGAWFPEYRDTPFADEWLAALNGWAR